LRRICDAYGLDADGPRRGPALNAAIATGGEFVRRHAEAGEPEFVKVRAEIGGMERFDRRRTWWAEARRQFEAALL